MKKLKGISAGIDFGSTNSIVFIYDEEQKNKILKHIDGRYWYILDKIHFFRLNCIDILNII